MESLFLTLMSEFWEVLTPVILSLMQEYQTPINFDDVNAILMKDASKFVIQHFYYQYLLILGHLWPNA